VPRADRADVGRHDLFDVVQPWDDDGSRPTGTRTTKVPGSDSELTVVVPAAASEGAVAHARASIELAPDRELDHIRAVGRRDVRGGNILIDRHRAHAHVDRAVALRIHGTRIGRGLIHDGGVDHDDIDGGDLGG
jgi:hypothetical protein